MVVQDYMGPVAGRQGATGAVGNVGPIFGWSNQDWDPDIVVGSHQEPVYGPRMISEPAGADVLDPTPPPVPRGVDPNWWARNSAPRGTPYLYGLSPQPYGQNVRPEVSQQGPGFHSITTNNQRPAQEDFIDPKTGQISSRDVQDVVGQKDAPTSIKASDLMKMYAGNAQSKDPAERKDFLDLQDKLIKAGLLKKKQYTRGVFDEATSKALEQVLITAGQMGTSLPDTLDAYAQGSQGGGDGSQRDKVTRSVRLTDPNDVRQSAINQSPNLLGRGIDPSTAASLAAQYNALEAQQQNAIYDAQDANTGEGSGVMTYNQPDLNTFVQQQLRASDPNAAQGMSLGHYLSEFMALMAGSGSSGSPTTFRGGNG